MITFVYAQDKNNGIGYQNQLPWHLPNDLKFFKKVTMGKTIVMGRKTFESMGQRLLPGRQTIVVTTQQGYGQDIEGLVVVHELSQLLAIGETTELMVIGGAEVFQWLMPYATKIIRTIIDDEFACDVFMPELDMNEWQVENVIDGIVDEKNRYPHQFQYLTRM